jgi:hypothetical protein
MSETPERPTETPDVEVSLASFLLRSDQHVCHTYAASRFERCHVHPRAMRNSTSVRLPCASRSVAENASRLARMRVLMSPKLAVVLWSFAYLLTIACVLYARRSKVCVEKRLRFYNGCGCLGLSVMRSISKWIDTLKVSAMCIYHSCFSLMSFSACDELHCRKG